MGLGADHEGLGDPDKADLRHRLFPGQGQGRPVRVRPGGLRHLGGPFPGGGTRPRRPHRARRQEGQFLDDGRNRALRALLGDPPEPPALRRRGRRAASSSMRARPAASRSGTTSSSSSTRTPDGTFSPLAAKHVDTGMGFERVSGIHASSKGFTDFSAEPSNYDSDMFAPIFARVAELSGKTYKGTVPTRRLGLTRAGAYRRRLPRARRPRPLRVVRHLRRDPPGQRGPQLRHPQDPSPRGPLRPSSGAPDRLLRAAGRAGRRLPGRRLPGAAAPGVHPAPGDQVRGGELREDA